LTVTLTIGFLGAAADYLDMASGGKFKDPNDPSSFKGCYAAFWADAIGTWIGGILGTSSVTTYGESMTGIAEGGRTGLTALWIAFFNFLCMFLAPFISSIPTISTGPALLMVGVFMASGLQDIDWHDPMQAIPSLLTVLLMPVTYKIEVGICAGILVLLTMQIFSLRIFLHIPGCYDMMPDCLKSFISNQKLSAYERSLIEGTDVPVAVKEVDAKIENVSSTSASDTVETAES